MRQHKLVKRITRWRALSSFAAAVAVAVGAALSSSDALGRVDPLAQPTGSAFSLDTVALVTGGGTVTVTAVPNFVASFGLNAKRPAGFTGGGAAQGRINYDRHAQVADRHVNVPVTLMSAELSTTPSPNGRGGRAQIVGDCTATGTECPAGTSSVFVEVTDASDTGAGDVFNISFCTGPANTLPPSPCGLAEGGTSIRTGQIQIRPTFGGGSAQAPAHVAAPRLTP